MCFCTPRFSMHSVITSPTYSSGTRMFAAMIGSRISAISLTGGSLDGLSTRLTLARIVDDLVDDGRRGGDQVQVVLALQPLLHDLHVQHAEEAAAKTEAQRGRRLRFEVQRRVVQPQLLQRLAKVLVVVRLNRKQPANTCGCTCLNPGKGLAQGAAVRRDRVADRRAVDLLDAGNHEADLAGAERVAVDSSSA